MKRNCMDMKLVAPVSEYEETPWVIPGSFFLGNEGGTCQEQQASSL